VLKVLSLVSVWGQTTSMRGPTVALHSNTMRLETAPWTVPSVFWLDRRPAFEHRAGGMCGIGMQNW